MNIKDIINLKFKNIEKDTIYSVHLKTASTNQAPKPIIVYLISEAMEFNNRWKKKKRNQHDFIFPVLQKSMSK